jgi:glycosyltransferase involved in cell wall biosynthesis
VRVLVISQYYVPEPGATQNRMSAFVEGLRHQGHRVTVVCEQPNHPEGVFQPGFGRRPVATERAGNVTVHRLWVAASPRKTPARRLAFYGSFALGAAAATAGLPRHDVVYATSPPLPGPLAAAAACRARRVPFVLDVRDLWPAAAEALGELSSPRAIRVLERAERWLYRSSRAVTATTQPFCSHVDAVAGMPLARHVPNGALDELLELDVADRPGEGTFVVGYTGNIGLAQGLGIVLDAAGRLREHGVRFRVVGGGPLAAAFGAERDRRGLDAVDVEPAVPVADVAKVLESCDALLVPLRDHSLLDHFIPSKLYDAMAVGRPAIVAAGGEAARLVRETGSGLVIPPEDGGALADAILRLRADRPWAAQLGEAGRRAAGQHARSRQLSRLEQILLEASGSPDEGAVKAGDPCAGS